MIPPFVDAEFIAAHPQAVLADVRWYLDGRDGRAAYEASHITGALWVDLDQQLAADDQPATEGRHPFPTPGAFAAGMGSLGIGNNTVVIAYDDTGGLTAGRLVVMLRMLGCDAAVLVGGLATAGAVGTTSGGSAIESTRQASPPSATACGTYSGRGCAPAKQRVDLERHHRAVENHRDSRLGDDQNVREDRRICFGCE